MQAVVDHNFHRFAILSLPGKVCLKPHAELMPWLHSIMVISLASFACSKRCSNPFLTRWLFLTFMKSTSCFNLQKWSPNSYGCLPFVVWQFLMLERMIVFFARNQGRNIWRHFPSRQVPYVIKTCQGHHVGCPHRPSCKCLLQRMDNLMHWHVARGFPKELPLSDGW